MKRYIAWGIALLLLATFAAKAQDTFAVVPVTSVAIPQDTSSVQAVADTAQTLGERELRRQKRAKRNFHYNILGGPSYSPDFGLLVGGSALMTFSLNPKDSTLKRSVVPAALAFMFDGGINLFFKPQLFFKGDRFRIFGKFSYKNTVENYYGIGYTTNRDYVRSDSTSRYRYSGVQINPWFLFRLGEGNFFAGPQVDILYDHFTNPGKYLVQEPTYVASGGHSGGYTNFNAGLGFLLTYDSRDVPANAYEGIYLDLRGMATTRYLAASVTFIASSWTIGNTSRWGTGA